MAYIWVRFGDLKYGAATVVALLHDVLMTLAAVGLSHFLSEVGFFQKVLLIEPFRLNLTLVAAILTVMGYSMNDTVVVFDRLRENLRKYKRMPLAEVIDLSINEMLTRTIVTSFTGLLALIALAVFGGPTLWGLSVIMLFGIVVGTYSSIYIAAPILLLWGVKRGEEEPEVLKPAKARP
jgi:preprotein translocase subunit SecF/SecD/SecF fusion protein